MPGPRALTALGSAAAWRGRDEEVRSDPGKAAVGRSTLGFGRDGGVMFDRYLARWNLTPDGNPVVTRSARLLPVRRHGEAAMLKIAIEPEERFGGVLLARSEEHTSELQSLMRISYAVFCLKKTINSNQPNNQSNNHSICTQ